MYYIQVSSVHKESYYRHVNDKAVHCSAAAAATAAADDDDGDATGTW